MRRRPRPSAVRIAVALAAALGFGVASGGPIPAAAQDAAPAPAAAPGAATPGGAYGLRPAPAAGLPPRDARGAVEDPDILVGLDEVRRIEANLAGLETRCRPWAEGASVVVRHAGGGRVRIAEPLRTDSGQFTGRRIWYVLEGVPVAVRDPFGWWLFDRAGRTAARLGEDGAVRRLTEDQRRWRTAADRGRLDAMMLGFGGTATDDGALADPALCRRVGAPVEVPAP